MRTLQFQSKPELLGGSVALDKVDKIRKPFGLTMKSPAKTFNTS